MKELLTKSFWQGVKKTYDEALKGPEAEEGESAKLPAPSKADAEVGQAVSPAAYAPGAIPDSMPPD
jgi:hypothetical protein